MHVCVCVGVHLLSDVNSFFSERYVRTNIQHHHRNIRIIVKYKRNPSKSIKECKETSYKIYIACSSSMQRCYRGDLIQLFKLINHLDEINVDQLSSGMVKAPEEKSHALDMANHLCWLSLWPLAMGFYFYLKGCYSLPSSHYAYGYTRRCSYSFLSL